MDTNLSIQDRLKEYDNSIYLSSILMINHNVPLFEETYGKHEYDWLLRVTKDRKCTMIDPCVIRHLTGNNLSMDPEYRLEDLNLIINIFKEDKNWEAIHKAYQTTAKFFYKIGDYRTFRSYILMFPGTWKSIAYYLTSFIPSLARWVVKKFNVFG